MSEFGMFWNSRDGDRKYNADDFTDWLKKFFTNGVFNGELYVTSTGGMGISVSPGYVNVDGKVMFFEESQLFTLDVASSSYNRVDTVVIEKSDVDRLFTCKVVKGGNDGRAIPPVRENGIYQLVLAQIAIRRGASSITQENVTDTRMDSNLCGYVAGTVDEITWDQITAQWTQYLEDYKHNQLEDYTEWTAEMKAAWLAWIAEQETGFTQWESDRHDEWTTWIGEQQADYTEWSEAQRALWTGWIATQETDFLAWYDRMKDQLSEDAAGHLQNEIDNLTVQWTQYTLLAGGWNRNTGIYSLENEYPSSGYNIVDVLPRYTDTIAQKTAWTSANCGGYYDTNILLANGEIPSIDIPVLLGVQAINN